MGLIRRLTGAMSREQMDGIRLSDPRWVLTGKPPDPSLFFGALPELVPGGVFLFIEGGSHPAELRSLINLHEVEVPLRPALGTLWPRHEYFTLRVLSPVMEQLARVVARLPVPEICGHLHVFDGDRVLLGGYDAFLDPFQVSGHLEEQRLRAFCDAVICGYREA